MRTSDISVHVLAPHGMTEAQVRAAVWRRAMTGKTLDVVKILAIDWRKDGGEPYHYGDDDSVWKSLRPILRTVGYYNFTLQRGR